MSRSKKPITSDAPTAKQLRYASILRLEVPEGATRYEVSELIREIEFRDPGLRTRREQVAAKVRERKFGKERIAEELRWRQFADQVGYCLAIYRQGAEFVVDVLFVSDANLDSGGRLELIVQAPIRRRCRYLGQYLEWERCFTLRLGRLVHYEPLHSKFHDAGIAAYQSQVRAGLRTARHLLRADRKSQSLRSSARRRGKTGLVGNLIEWFKSAIASHNRRATARPLSPTRSGSTKRSRGNE